MLRDVVMVLFHKERARILIIRPMREGVDEEEATV